MTATEQPHSHELSLIRADVAEYQTDCSTPTFIMVRSMRAERDALRARLNAPLPDKVETALHNLRRDDPVPLSAFGLAALIERQARRIAELEALLLRAHSETQRDSHQLRAEINIALSRSRASSPDSGATREKAPKEDDSREAPAQPTSNQSSSNAGLAHLQAEHAALRADFERFIADFDEYADHGLDERGRACSKVAPGATIARPCTCGLTDKIKAHRTARARWLKP